MKWKTFYRAAALIATVFGMQPAAHCAQGERPYLFNVVNQRGVALTAEYWNPILTYVSQKSGVSLELRLNRTPANNIAMAETGAYDFLYTNHFFTPERDRLGFHAIARTAGPGIRSMIVVAKDSPIRSLRDLDGKTVAFATPDSFAGYWLPMDHLLRSKINFKTEFSGNQEASFAQLSMEKVDAAGVNSQSLEVYVHHETFAYRVLWTSELYGDLCIMANPKVPAEKVAAVRDALIGMAGDPEGVKILQSSAEILKMQSLAFVGVDNQDYDNYRTFFSTTLVRAPK